jgi:flavin-dependent dehydrogenase
VAPLVALGVWEAFLAARHVPATGTLASWGGPTTRERDTVFDAYGCGWHLDRTRFDAMLLTAAEDAGVQVLTATVVGCRRAADDGWTLRMAGPGPAALQAAWVVDASGRGARIARHEVVRTRHDRLLALARFYLAPDREDTRTVVEATEAGWWYYAPLPGERAVAVLFTDADLLPGGAAGRARSWDELLAATRLVRNRLGPATAASPLRVAPAHTGSLARACGRGWLAVGDAAQSWDPLSGQGVLTSLGSALAAAEALEPGQPVEPALERYAEWVRAGFRDYLRQRSVQYGRERRWADSPFWRRRAAPGFTRDDLRRSTARISRSAPSSTSGGDEVA